LWAFGATLLAPVRVAAPLFFCPCWRVRPSAPATFSWLFESIGRRIRPRRPTCGSMGLGAFFRGNGKRTAIADRSLELRCLRGHACRHRRRRSGRHPRTGHLVLQRKRADRRTASPVIAALCQVGGQNANRQSEHERGGDDYALGHHESPLGLLGHPAPIAVYSTAACDARHRFGEYIVEHAEHVSIVIAKNYSRRASLARLVPWIVSERSFSRPLKPRRVRGFL